MSFDASEDQDGVRFSWNVWPSSRLEATRSLVVPLGCIYSPGKRMPQTPIVYYEPVMCKGSCRSILNPYCSVDVRGKIWICPFCYQRNQFPGQYADISETNLPAELIPNYSTIDYVLPQRQAPVPPIFLIVLDTCLPEQDLQALKDSVILSLSLIPENSRVGLITFGATVQVYELAFGECPKSFVFRGNKEVTSKQVTELLGLTSRPQPKTPTNQPPPAFRENGFLIPLSECEFAVTSILEELQRDPRPTKSDKRPLRATGVALSVAVGLLENVCPNAGARVMLFVGGPATGPAPGGPTPAGPGIIVSDELKEPIRSHSDISKDKAKYLSKSQKFYEGLAKRAITNGHAVDIFACSGDQVGLLEMRDLVKQTGGLLVLSDVFDHPMFKNSFQRIFVRDNTSLNFGYNATIEVQCTRELKVCGAIGHLASASKAGTSVAETEIGIGNTCAWKLGAFDPNSSLAFYFEIVNQHTNPIPPGQNGLIQFTTQYQNAQGQRILRVTTISRPFVESPRVEPGRGDASQGNSPLSNGFDQEAAAVLMARMAVFKADSGEEPADILRWIDRMLIRLVGKFGEYAKDNPSSFKLSPQFSIYPQFMFHLRRSNFLQTFGNSPDESTYYRIMLNRENVSNSLVMIQPTLEAYSFTGPPSAVLLSAASITPDRILLLDTFFQILVHHGDTIAGWRKEGYAENPAHTNFRNLLQAPKDDAAATLKDRFPYPRYIECDQGGSQARFLLAAVDPSLTHNALGTPTSGEVIFTDDVNLKVFLEHLKKLAVAA